VPLAGVSHPAYGPQPAIVRAVQITVLSSELDLIEAIIAPGMFSVITFDDFFNLRLYLFGD
jgi:hypothetical protein